MIFIKEEDVKSIVSLKTSYAPLINCDAKNYSNYDYVEDIEKHIKALELASRKVKVSYSHIEKRVMDGLIKEPYVSDIKIPRMINIKDFVGTKSEYDNEVIFRKEIAHAIEKNNTDVFSNSANSLHDDFDNIMRANIPDIISEDVNSLIIGRAYDEGHAYGIAEVYSCYRNLISMASEIISLHEASLEVEADIKI